MKLSCAFASIAILAFVSSYARADTFGSGANTFTINFVTVGNPRNPDDTNSNPDPVGSVDYTYRIGKFEISEQMINKANALGNLGITKDSRGPNKPATNISWFEAAEFVNWLNTSTGHTPAYKFDLSGNFQLWQPSDLGYNPNNLFRNSRAYYFLPNVDEWYKAAYFDPISGVYYDYPTSSNYSPIATSGGTEAGTAVIDEFGLPNMPGPADIDSAGALSSFGTMAQGGNVSEFEETEVDLVNDSPTSRRGYRGGDWLLPYEFLLIQWRLSYAPEFSSRTLGFRVASKFIPEPSTALLAVAGLAILLRRSRL